MPNPIHTWCFINRQRYGRVTARTIANFQPKEEWWTAFDFTDLLANHYATVDSVLWTNETLPGLINVGEGFPIEGNLVYVKINVPSDAPTGAYQGVELHVRDNKDNRFTGSALLFISEGVI